MVHAAADGVHALLKLCTHVPHRGVHRATAARAICGEGVNSDVVCTGLRAEHILNKLILCGKCNAVQ